MGISKLDLDPKTADLRWLQVRGEVGHGGHGELFAVGVPVDIDTGTADGLVTVVLLDGGLLPTAKGTKVAEGGATIVMGIPQRQRGATRPVAHDGGPLGL